MRCRLLNLLTLLSFVLCVIVLTFWIRSFWRSDVVHLITTSHSPAGDRFRRWSLESEGGRVIGHLKTDAFPPGGWDRAPAKISQDWSGPMLRGRTLPLPWPARTSNYIVESLHDFHADSTSGPLPPNGVRVLSYVNAPHWGVLLPLTVLPVARGWRRWRTARGRGGRHCVRCGYDLRASPDRCPECGAIAEARALG